MFPFILPLLWPSLTVVHASLLYLFPSFSPTPVFYLSLSLWMSCPWITGACGGLSETCVEGWRRLMGSPSSSGSSFLLKSSSQWGRKPLSEFKDRNLLAFYRILFSTEWINRKTLLTLNHSLWNTEVSWKTGSYIHLSAQPSVITAPAFSL